MKFHSFCLCMCRSQHFQPRVVGSSPAAALPLQKAEIFRHSLGALEVIALSDGAVEVSFDKLLTGICPEQTRLVLAQAGKRAMVTISINVFLICTSQKLILVDTGSGDLFGSGAGGLLEESLHAAGYEASQVDAILLTHIHADHSGGLLKAGRRVFPNAKLYVEETEINYWFDTHAEERAPAHRKHSFPQGRASLQPYLDAGQVHTFHGETRLFPEIRSIPAPGHTPGHTLYMIESEGQRLLLWGDLVHSEDIQLANPEVAIKFDSDERAAVLQRIKVLAQSASENLVIGGAHIAFPGLGHLRCEGHTYGWKALGNNKKLF